jgi:Mg2+/citrate symporter
MICCTCDDCFSTSKPIMNTLPWVGPISPVMMFIKVDFPVHVQDRSRLGFA